MHNHSWLYWIIFGLVAGAVAKAIHPGKDPGGCLVTIVIGIVGALIGGYIGTRIGWGDVHGFDLRSFGLAVGGSLILLFLWNMISGRR